jgi:uncharacterized protein YjdB
MDFGNINFLNSELTGVTLSPDLAQLVVGQKTTFTATVAPSDVTNKTIAWSRVSGVACTIEQNTAGTSVSLTAQATDTVTLRATIANGKLQ